MTVIPGRSIRWQRNATNFICQLGESHSWETHWDFYQPATAESLHAARWNMTLLSKSVKDKKRCLFCAFCSLLLKLLNLYCTFSALCDSLYTSQLYNLHEDVPIFASLSLVLLFDLLSIFIVRYGTLGRWIFCTVLLTLALLKKNPEETRFNQCSYNLWIY